MKFLLASAELRAMFEVARRYTTGAASVHELNGAICNARDMAAAAGADSAVLSLLDDWCVMVNRRWNEWGLERQPITEEEFQAWLREQLVSPEHAG